MCRIPNICGTRIYQVNGFLQDITFQIHQVIKILRSLGSRKGAHTLGIQPHDLYSRPANTFRHLLRIDSVVRGSECRTFEVACGSQYVLKDSKQQCAAVNRILRLNYRISLRFVFEGGLLKSIVSSPI